MLKTISRLIVGIVFVFSGFVKTIDPLGSAYKFGDYFSAFGIGFLEPLALPLSILLSSVEIIMGIALLFAYRMRFFSWLTIIFMSFFTVLTLILALFNPVSDCGCFGDALILTNWQTFWKNIVIMIFVIIVFTKRTEYRVISRASTEWIVMSLIFGFFIAFSLYSYFHLPLVDFRPYSVGSDIAHKMIVPPDAPADVYETRLTYINKASGKKEIFSLENFPSDTSAYEFSDAESILISKGYEPPIHDFYISNMSGTDITDIILNDPGFSLLLISHDLSKANKKAMLEAEKYANFAKVFENIRFYAITASSASTIDRLSSDLDLDYEFYQADEITLKTIIRANPGLVLIKNGIILGKWHFNDFPEFGISENDFENLINNYPFVPGSNINALNDPPPGTGNDEYESTLYYRNILTDSISSFSISDFPSSPEWEFIRSESKIIRKAYKTPLDEFKPLTPEGIDLSAEIFISSGNVFLLMVKDPVKADRDLLTRFNNLCVLAASSDTAVFRFFALTAIPEMALLEFLHEFITPVQFGIINEKYFDKISENSLKMIWIRNAIVMDVLSDENIPEPTDFSDYLNKPGSEMNTESFILSPVITSCHSLLEKRLVYLFIFGFIAFGLLVFLINEDIRSLR